MSKKEQARQYLEEIINLGKKYGLSLAHEDSHGGFIVEDRAVVGEDNDGWLLRADIDRLA